MAVVRVSMQFGTLFVISMNLLSTPAGFSVDGLGRQARHSRFDVFAGAGTNFDGTRMKIVPGFLHCYR